MAAKVYMDGDGDVTLCGGTLKNWNENISGKKQRERLCAWHTHRRKCLVESVAFRPLPL